MGKTKELFAEIRQLEQQALDGEINELDAYIEIDELEKECKRAKDTVKDSAIKEAEKHGKKSFDYSGRTIELRSSGKWHYGHIPEWKKINEKQKAIEEKAKMAAKSGLNASDETGEVITPAIHKDTTYLAIKKKK